MPPLSHPLWQQQPDLEQWQGVFQHQQLTYIQQEQWQLWGFHLLRICLISRKPKCYPTEISINQLQCWKGPVFTIKVLQKSTALKIWWDPGLVEIFSGEIWQPEPMADHGHCRAAPRDWDWSSKYMSHLTTFIILPLSGGFLKWWYPTTMGCPTKNDHFGVFWGYHHLRKHPSLFCLCLPRMPWFEIVPRFHWVFSCLFNLQDPPGKTLPPTKIPALPWCLAKVLPTAPRWEPNACSVHNWENKIPPEVVRTIFQVQKDSPNKKIMFLKKTKLAQSYFLEAPKLIGTRKVFVQQTVDCHVT